MQKISEDDIHEVQSLGFEENPFEEGEVDMEYKPSHAQISLEYPSPTQKFKRHIFQLRNEECGD